MDNTRQRIDILATQKYEAEIIFDKGNGPKRCVVQWHTGTVFFSLRVIYSAPSAGNHKKRLIVYLSLGSAS